jgi:hypothetical protein
MQCIKPVLTVAQDLMTVGIFLWHCNKMGQLRNEPGRSLSRDSLTAKSTSAKARKIKNSTRNWLFKNEPVPAGVAMSELSYGTKKHTSKSRETIPLKWTGKMSFPPFLKKELKSSSVYNSVTDRNQSPNILLDLNLKAKYGFEYHPLSFNKIDNTEFRSNIKVRKKLLC